jgi:hypothetical protein
MEVVDNAILLLWPGAMDAGLRDALFWISLAIALAVARGPTFVVNRALICHGKGHTLAHGAHGVPTSAVSSWSCTGPRRHLSRHSARARSRSREFDSPVAAVP